MGAKCESRLPRTDQRVRRQIKEKEGRKEKAGRGRRWLQKEKEGCRGINFHPCRNNVTVNLLTVDMLTQHIFFFYY